MNARLMASAAAVAAAALIAAGCGGSDDPVEPIGTTTDATEPQATTLSKRELINELDPRCAEAGAAIAGLSSGPSGDDLALLASQEEQITRGLLRSANGLATAEDPSGALDRFISGLRKQASIDAQRTEAAQSGDTVAYDALGGELAQAKADTRLAAEEYGFQDCGQEATAIAPTTPDGGATPAPVPAPATPAPAPAPAPAPGGGTGSGGSGGGSSGGVSPG